MAIFWKIFGQRSPCSRVERTALQDSRSRQLLKNAFPLTLASSGSLNKNIHSSCVWKKHRMVDCVRPRRKTSRQKRPLSRNRHPVSQWLWVVQLKPNYITLAGSKLVRSWSQTC